MIEYKKIKTHFKGHEIVEYQKIIQSGFTTSYSFSGSKMTHTIYPKYRPVSITRDEYLTSPEGKAELVYLRFSQNKPLPSDESRTV